MIETTLITESHYLGNITYYKKLLNGKYVIFKQYEEHKKSSFSNRCEIAGANGKIILSVPLEKGRSQRTVVRDIRIWNAENWQLRHWRSILSSYNNSPWFKYCSDDLAVLFSRPYSFLLDWNMACVGWSLKVLKVDLSYRLASEKIEELPAGMEDMRNKILPAQGNLSSIRYQQVFENKIGFLPDLSILDLIFCEGPKGAMSLLQHEQDR